MDGKKKIPFHENSFIYDIIGINLHERTSSKLTSLINDYDYDDITTIIIWWLLYGGLNYAVHNT